MSKVHEMSLREPWFSKVFQGKKTIELRLYDDKRKKIKVGDTIKFNRAGETVFFEARVKGLVLANSFRELAEIVPCEKCGFNGVESMIETMEEFYPINKQYEIGVVGIVLTF